MPENFAELVAIFINLILTAIPVLIALAFMVFLYGLVQFISKAGDEKSHGEGKNIMKLGLIGLFVMMSFFGIVEFFVRDFGATSFGIPLLPPER
ncbi:MAG: hypothetical protein AB200_00225 [Parcubacteria bacterium C7867-005]|nr:MAG: hypothetical protein AB200_00225 [Parcubacteria bacterium C7867-005]